MTLPIVVHLSGDFPDTIDRNKTRVIESLLDLTEQRFEHTVYSINRVAISPVSAITDFIRTLGRPRGQIDDWQRFERGVALGYRAPGRGLLHATYLKTVAVQIADQLQANPPALVVGHKLTIEGIVARNLAQRIGRPYAITIQGDTDTKILAARPDLKALFAKIYHGAAHVFCFAPWALIEMERRLGTRDGPVTVLPCPTELDKPLPPKGAGRDLISVFHLKNCHRKNLAGMVGAMKILAKSAQQTGLVVYGGGSAADEQAAMRIASVTPSVRLGGAVDRAQMPLRMNEGVGFVLPSRRETFGLVFIEALFAGLPIIYPQGQAISGYFKDAPFALAVDSCDTAAIARAMATLVHKEGELKAALADWQSSSDARRFQRPSIGDAFAQGLLNSIVTSNR
ncbi:hypothetical protein B2G71_19315 [Novosphingobium sp. PC22D]|uniref:glycosyltransferase n=1 Tax=Novosphingobium sp. PC22D TaxID=1962403 RepID=UPI000BF0BDDB|nr:glycosyltransferase [Novosphingobium sp. PC22D]PEQ10969.1 hypothetical protein B2G71_19315 [Novosphingobium sp. PC22D]